MCTKHLFAKATRLKKAKTEQNRISKHGPYGGVCIGGGGYSLHKGRIYGHADHNKETLETEGEQGLDVIVPHLAPIPADL